MSLLIGPYRKIVLGAEASQERSDVLAEAHGV
jgi:hypothetical protein